MDNKDLKYGLRRTMEGLESLANPESEVRKIIEEANKFDLLISLDVFNMERTYEHLKKMAKDDFKFLLNGRVTLENFSTKEKFVSILKDIFVKKKGRHHLSTKQKIKFFFSDFRDLTRKYKICLYGILYIHLMLTGTFIFSFIGLQNPILSSIGLVISIIFGIGNFMILDKEVIWRY